MAGVDERHVERHEGHARAKLRILLSVEGEDAQRVERLARARGQKASDVIADLLRAADRSAG